MVPQPSVVAHATKLATAMIRGLTVDRATPWNGQDSGGPDTLVSAGPMLQWRIWQALVGDLRVGGVVSIHREANRPETGRLAVLPAPLLEPVPQAFALVEAKLTVPPGRSGIVARSALVDRLRASRDIPVVTVVAPAGYGKTTLLRQWAGRERRRVAWVSLDEGDNDPTVFLTYIATALDRIERIDPDVFQLLASPGTSTWSSVIPRLGAALPSMTEPIVLVLDDVHELHNPECADAIASLAADLPPRSQLALASRTEPPVPLARLRARGHLFEVGAGELALGEREAAELLQRAGVELPASQVAELVRTTEGWPTGIYLAARSFLAEGAAADADAGSGIEFAGDDRFVADYLRSELLARLAPTEERFLVQTSVLERMSGPLCDAVLDVTGSADVLEQLERSNLFVVPLDRRRRWYRYHNLFRDLLRSELDRREPDAAPALCRRAAAWFEAHGQPEFAIEYAHAGGDTERVARLLEVHALRVYYSGRAATLERWFSWFEDEGLLEHYPAIAVFGAWVHALAGRDHEAGRWADSAARGHVERPMSDGSPSLEPWLAMLHAALCRDGVDRMLEDSLRSVGLLPSTSLWRATSIFLLAIADLLRGDVDEADRQMAESVKVAEASGATVTAAVALAERAVIAGVRGDWATAEDLIERARILVQEARLEEDAGSALYYAVAARLALRRGDVDRARAEIGRAQRLRPQLSAALPYLSVQVRLELGRAHLALGDAGGTRTLLVEIDGILRQRPDLGVLNDQVRELHRSAEAMRGGTPGASTLTAAELRLLPYLPTHLSFREIAQRLYVSPNTVKTQAISVYGKLGASSRSEAIRRAVESGLLDPTVGRIPSNITRSG